MDEEYEIEEAKRYDILTQVYDGLAAAGFKAKLIPKDREIEIQTIYGEHNIEISSNYKRYELKIGGRHWSLSPFAKQRGFMKENCWHSHIAVKIDNNILRNTINILSEIRDVHEEAFKELTKQFPEAKIAKRKFHTYCPEPETDGFKIMKKKAVSLTIFPYMGKIEVVWRFMQLNGGSKVETDYFNIPLDPSKVRKIRKRFDKVAVVDIQRREATVEEKTTKAILTEMANEIGDWAKMGTSTINDEKAHTLKIERSIFRLGEFRLHVNIDKSFFVIWRSTPTKEYQTSKILVADPKSVDLVLARCDSHTKMIRILEEEMGKIETAMEKIDKIKIGKDDDSEA